MIDKLIPARSALKHVAHAKERSLSPDAAGHQQSHNTSLYTRRTATAAQSVATLAASSGFGTTRALPRSSLSKMVTAAMASTTESRNSIPCEMVGGRKSSRNLWTQAPDVHFQQVSQCEIFDLSAL